MGTVELDLIARFHVRLDEVGPAEAALAEVAHASRSESGCLGFEIFRARTKPALFFIHSKWRSQAAFDHHAEFDHTRRFIEAMESLVDQPPEIILSERIWPARP